MPLEMRCHLTRDHGGGHVYVPEATGTFRVTSCMVPMVPLAPEFAPTMLRMVRSGLTRYEATGDRTGLEDARMAIGVLWGLTEPEEAA